MLILSKFVWCPIIHPGWKIPQEELDFNSYSPQQILTSATSIFVFRIRFAGWKFSQSQADCRQRFMPAIFKMNSRCRTSYCRIRLSPFLEHRKDQEKILISENYGKISGKPMG